MNENLKEGMVNKFCIEFKTSAVPGKVLATQVILEQIIMGKKDSVRLDLCDHPLYPLLEQYVLANPSEDEEDE